MFSSAMSKYKIAWYQINPLQNNPGSKSPEKKNSFENIVSKEENAGKGECNTIVGASTSYRHLH